MDFTFTPEQKQLRDSVGRYLDRSYDFEKRQELVRSDAPYSPEVWATFAELGLLALPFSEESGGVGGTIADVVAAAEVFGERLVVEPYVGTVLLAGQALAAADSDVARDLLGRVIEGEAQVGFAYEEGRGTADPSTVSAVALEDGDGLRINADKRMVLGGADVDAYVVAAHSGVPGAQQGSLVLALVPADAAGVEVTAFKTVDGRAAANVLFTDVAVPADHVLTRDADELLPRIIADAIVALGAEAVGAMGALLEQTSRYTSTRKQFGVPILSFQSLAHRVANMKMAYTKARATLLYTTALVEAGQASARDISVLKAQIGRLGREVGESAVQAHGGIGMTDELPIGHYLKRLMAIDKLFGSSEYHLRVIGSLAPAAS